MYTMSQETGPQKKQKEFQGDLILSITSLCEI